MSTALPLVAAGGITDFNTTLFWSTLVLFAIFAFVLSKLAWGPLLHAIEEREKGVRDGVEGAHKANAEAQALLQQHKEMLQQAGREREDIIKRAMQEADQVKNDLVAKARTESEGIVSRAREQIEREKNQAISELRGQVADLAVAAAAKIVSSSLTPEAQKKLADDYIKALPSLKQ